MSDLFTGLSLSAQLLGSFLNSHSQRKMATRQKQLSLQMAHDARQRGGLQIDRHRLQTQQLKGLQQVSAASNGIDIHVGSAAQLQASTDLLSQQDIETIRRNATRAAWGLQTAMQSIEPRTAQLSHLLTGTAQVAPQWYQRYQNLNKKR